MAQPAAQEGSTQQPKQAKFARGTRELTLWGDTEREQAVGGLFTTPQGRTLRERVKEEHASALRGARSARQPTDLPAALVRHLEVECAFIRLAQKGAMEYIGVRETDFDFDSLDGEHQALYSDMVERGAQLLRSMCWHVFVQRRPRYQFRCDYAYARMALFGLTRTGFDRFVRDRIEAVKATIEQRSRDDSPAE